MGLSLMRSPVFPDLLADEGHQSFTYALLPHLGDWFEGGVLAEAEDLNQPLLVAPTKLDRDQRWQAVVVEGRPLALSALKPDEAGDGLILRMYEPSGGRSRPKITVASGWAVGGQVNLLEEPLEGSAAEFGPFQIRSLHLKRT